MEEILVIINPKSDKIGIESILKKKLLKYAKLTFLYTSYKKEIKLDGFTAIEYSDLEIKAKKIISKKHFTDFIICGGDGLINSIVNSIMKFGKPNESIISIIPIGTGNDFADSALNIKDIKSSIDAINHYYSQKNTNNYLEIDILKIIINDGTAQRYTSYEFGLSFSRKMIRWIDDRPHIKKRFKKLVYPISFLSAYKKHKKFDFDIQIQKENEKLKFTSKKNVLLTILNTKKTSGGTLLAPYADPSNNSFDIFIAQEMSLAKAAPLLLLSSKGIDITKKSKKIKYLTRCNKMTVFPKRPIGSIQINGDLFYHSNIKKVECEIVNKIRFIKS